MTGNQIYRYKNDSYNNLFLLVIAKRRSHSLLCWLVLNLLEERSMTIAQIEWKSSVGVSVER